MSPDQIRFISKTINYILGLTIVVCLFFSVTLVWTVADASHSDYSILLSESFYFSGSSHSPELYRNILVPYVIISTLKFVWKYSISEKTIPNKEPTKELLKVVAPLVVWQIFFLSPIYYYKDYVVELAFQESSFFFFSIFAPTFFLVTTFWYRKFKKLGK